MQNSPAAMELKDRVLPPELKRLETALKSSGLKVDQDADVLAFAAFRDPAGEGTRIVGIAQGQFHTREILANFAKNKTKPDVLRNNSVYPMGSNGMSVVFLNQTTMVFGDKSAVKEAIDARDGIVPDFLSNGEMVKRDGYRRLQGRLEPARRKGHPDHDEERPRRRRPARRLRHRQKPHEEQPLHHGLPERRQVRHGRSHVRHAYRSDRRDADEGRIDHAQDLRLTS